MKNVILVLASLVLAACNDSDDNSTIVGAAFEPPTAAEFQQQLQSAVDARTQHFHLTTTGNSVSFTSAQGILVFFPPSSLYLHGEAITGGFDVDFVELFNASDMAVTNKPTMGIMDNGDHALMISGGEFYINATKDGQQLDIVAAPEVRVPISITDQAHAFQMEQWSGNITDGVMLWQNDAPENFVFATDLLVYSVYLNHFGWTNVDCFYTDPRPKTTILAQVPDGFNFQNSLVYLSYDGAGNGLARLDTYVTENVFSEHYGQIPIGLACHAIFLSVSAHGIYRYAIKAVTIIEGGTIVFTSNELQSGTKDQFISAVEAVQTNP